MNIRPEDRAKVAGIATVIAGLNGYVFATIVPKLSQGPGQVSPAKPAPPPPVAAATPALPPGQKSAIGVVDLPPKPELVALSDPFTPPAGSVPEPAAPPPAAKPAPQPHPGPSISAVAAHPAGPGQAPNGAVAPAGKSAPPPLPDVELKGMIDGSPAIAVFQVDGATLSKRQGDTLAGAFRVGKISEDGVVLTAGKRAFHLELGKWTGGDPQAPAGGPAAAPGQPGAPPYAGDSWAFTPNPAPDASSSAPGTVRMGSAPAAQQGGPAGSFQAAPRPASSSASPGARPTAAQPLTPPFRITVRGGAQAAKAVELANAIPEPAWLLTPQGAELENLALTMQELWGAWPMAVTLSVPPVVVEPGLVEAAPAASVVAYQPPLLAAGLTAPIPAGNVGQPAKP